MTRALKIIFVLGIGLRASLSPADPEPESDTARAFDVTSVKLAQHQEDWPSIRRLAPNYVAVSAMTLRDMIILFYHVRTYQLLGGPKWADENRYDVAGKYTTVDRQNHADALEPIDSGMQSLLTDRFKLHLQRGQKTLPIVSLEVRKHRQFQARPCAESYRLQHGWVEGDIRIASLASLLKVELKTPVRDDTGLLGCYHLEAHWTDNLNDSSAPQLLTAINDLGFKLRSTTGTVPTLTIVSAQQPTPD